MNLKSESSINALAFFAVTAALDVVDKSFKGLTAKPDGPCGDALAAQLEKVIGDAVRLHLAQSVTP